MKMKIKISLCLLVCTVASAAAVNAQTSLRIINYNMRMSGQMVNYNTAPFTEFFRGYDPDIVLMQEIDYKTTRNGQKDFVTELGAETGMFSAFGAAITYQQGEYGVAILSKYPIAKISNNPLSSNSSDLKEKRTVLYVEVYVPDDGGVEQKIRFAVTHLDHSTDQVRSDMVAQLNSYLASTGPVVLTGDFNAHPTEGAMMTMKSTWQQLCDNFPTFSSTNPASKIDYIFARPMGKWTVVKYERVVKTELSDHIALIADIEYNP